MRDEGGALNYELRITDYEGRGRRDEATGWHWSTAGCLGTTSGRPVELHPRVNHTGPPKRRTRATRDRCERRMKAQIEEHQRVVAAAAKNVELFAQMAERIIDRFANGGRLYVFGNGGSAADAQHIAAELVGRLQHDRKALPAIALTTDTSVLTAVSNDTGYERSFARQVEALVTKNDIVWTLSVSGTSPNVVRALESAKTIGALRIGFTGRSGGQFKELCDLCFHADHDSSDRVQEVHQLAYHLICDRIEQHYLR